MELIFATASVAGFTTKKIEGKNIGIVILEENDSGYIDFKDSKRNLRNMAGNFAE